MDPSVHRPGGEEGPMDPSAAVWGAPKDPSPELAAAMKKFDDRHAAWASKRVMGQAVLPTRLYI